MAQVKIYGLEKYLKQNKEEISKIIHFCLMEALKMPKQKKFQRFFYFKDEDFIYPDDRTETYIIIEISIFEGRTVETKKKLIKLLYEKMSDELKIFGNDLEITIFETPKCNWGIRGVSGDELDLNYKVDV